MGRKRIAPSVVTEPDNTPYEDATARSGMKVSVSSFKKLKLSHRQEEPPPADAVPAQKGSNNDHGNLRMDDDAGGDGLDDDDFGGDSDNDDSGEYNDLGDGHDEFEDDGLVEPMKKRKQSLSPPLLIPSEDWNWSSESPVCGEIDQAVQITEQDTAKGVTLKLTVNVPHGHHGPITLNLAPKRGLSSALRVPSAPPKVHKRFVTNKQTLVGHTQPPRRGAGFLDLAAELRNQIYRLVFVTKNPLSFGNPCGFSRSAALLRTCRQVYNEGRSILYSENTFIMKRRSTRYGSFWEPEWNELGFQPVRVFLKSIGPINTALLRFVRLDLQDAVPCLNPGLRSHDARRFVNDDVLVSVLRHLGAHALLQRLELFFHGRRRVQLSDERFLLALRGIKADDVVFVDNRTEEYLWTDSKQAPSVKTMLLSTCTRVHKMWPDEALRKAEKD